MVIDGADAILPHQRRNQHQERRLRQVEIGHQRIGHPEAIARVDENLGGAAERAHRAVLGRRAFDQPQRGGADRDDPPARGAGGVDLLGRRRGDLAPFRVHLVGLDVLDLHRQEGARAHMQRHLGERDALRMDRLKQRLGEMQARRRRGHGARVAREDRLVIGLVGLVGGAQRGDVGRQRHRPRRGQRRVEIGPRQVEGQPQLRRLDRAHLGRKRLREADRLALLQLAQRFRERRPLARGLRLEQRDLDLRGDLALPGHAGAGAAQPGRNHLGVVQHQTVARAEQIDQIRNMQIADPVPFRQQQLCRRARPRRARRNQPLGQIEVEIFKFHSVTIVGGARRKISRNMPGVKIDSGLITTLGAAAVPLSV
ncbi:hypothetical protein SDC9_18932 [bioreactor metagenome]|uniref:Uncharacterized protein n=1 Tax=bioreactor metagenome TaxID=1076179 RepID=A0A644U2J7_9ZZZZ